jgi:hypothetical protein
MKKRILYFGIVLVLWVCFITLFTRYRSVDAYVANSFSRDINEVHDLLNNMCNEISYDGKYKYYSLDDLTKLVEKTRVDLSDVSYRLNRYDSLNENFDVRLYYAEGIVDCVLGSLEEGRKLTQDELDILAKLVKLNEVYADLGASSTYIDNHNTLKLMPLPEKVNTYIDDLGALERAYMNL